jgi:hypothetical protein
MRLHIERLVLDGVDLPAQGEPALRAAMHSELRRLFAGGELPSSLRSGAAIASLPGDPMTLAPGPKPAAIGGSIAGAVHGGLTR